MVNILLIEDNMCDAILIEEMLKAGDFKDYRFDHAQSMKEADQCLAERRYDLILSDLSLPDSGGVDTVKKLCVDSPHSTIVVLTGLDDEQVGFEAVKKGAQDFLVKGEYDSQSLTRTIHFAMERNRLIQEVRSTSLTDDLTGTYNRRGFIALAKQQMKLARRNEKEFLILFIDIDRLKMINDVFGHVEGDNAIVRLAHIMRQTFRDSDIIARIGGDEFIVLAIESTAKDEGILIERLVQRVADDNAQAHFHVDLSVSIGTTVYDPKHPCSIEELLTRADENMYHNKMKKREERDV